MIHLPKTYTKEMWEKCKNPQNKKYIGKRFISWSQIETFNDKVGFNTGLEGELEYILRYLSGIKFPDMGWATFGHEVEGYITERLYGDKFSEKEKETLDKIKPLGMFQEEICYYIKELDVIVIGYIDDFTKPKKKSINLLRDYKTKSESSKKDLHDDKKHQLEIYILGLRQRGIEVENSEYCIIERLGGAECMRGGGRDVLKVGEKIWYEPYTWSEDRLKDTHSLIVDTVHKISDLNQTYLKIFS